MEPMLYTVKEVAQILKCNATRVYGLKDAGLLPFLKLGQLKCRREALRLPQPKKRKSRHAIS